MIDLTFDITTGAVRLLNPATIKTGSKVPVSVTFSEAPQSVASLTMKLLTDTAPPASKASATLSTQENDTLWTGTLDLTGTTALDTYMATLASAAMNLELSGTINGVERIAPNVSITVQPKAA